MNRTEELTKLLTSCFNIDELRRLIRYSSDEEVQELGKRLPNGSKVTHYDVAEAIAEFVEDGKFPVQYFFERIEQERPRRIFDINNVKALYM